MAPPRVLVASLAVVTVLAGCIGTPAQPSEGPRDLAPAAAGLAMAPVPRMELADCIEGGGHSNYNLGDIQPMMPEPWQLTDVTDDIGPVTITNTIPPTPATGPQSGIYHAAFRCQSFLLDGEEQGPLSGGFVGIRVEPPPFDTGPAALKHYLVVTFATDNDAVNAALGTAGLDLGTSAVTLDTVGPFFHSVLDEADHGVYESHFQPVEAGAKEDGIVRIWLQHGAEHHAAEGDLEAMAHDAPGIHPRALDLVDTGGEHFTAQDATAVFSHTRTNDHDQDFGIGVVVPVPGVWGQTAGLGYRGFSRVLVPGPQPAVALETAWDHL